MNNIKIIGFSLIGIAFAMFFSSSLFAQAKDKIIETEISRLQSFGKFNKVVSIIEGNNIEKIKIDEIINKALDGLLKNIDAHSSFLSKKDFKRLKASTDGKFGGLGISVGMKDGALTVIAPIDGTPADKAGLKSDDIILKIDDKSTIGMTIDEAVSLMRGKVGDPIDLAIVRKSEKKPLHINIVRDTIVVKSVHSKTIGNDILYVRVASFDKKVVNNVSKIIKNRHKETRGIILDLRNNPGGLLDQAVGLVNIFVDEGNIVSQKGRNKFDDRVYRANSRSTITDLPLVVLVNVGSASASEIVSGALQDHKRAIIIGEKTFGKGSVQAVLPISQTEAVKLTIARYYLPSGRTIQAVGVEPDIKILPGRLETFENEFAIKEADLKRHLEKELGKIQIDKKTDKKIDKNIITQETVKKDLQLKEAVNILKVLMITKGR